MDTLEDFAGWTHIASGKVRELYRSTEPADDPRLLMVASDRISAFDHLLEPPIPQKGEILTRLSRWWFDILNVPNHLLDEEGPAEIAERSMVVKALDMLPVECVVRGAITGSGFAEYRKCGTVCGIALPDGLEDGDLLEEPIFTPAYKAPQGEHDENITFERVCELVGKQTAEDLRARSIEIFTRARAIAYERGIILADTKFEFGVDPKTGEITLADEVLTSDSSRYWDADIYAQKSGAERMESFDKQIVRNWLQKHWDKRGVPPVLPQDIVEQTQKRYIELHERITGHAF